MARPSLSFLFPRDDGVPDAALLARFADGHDGAAFELLVRRYADVVWTVCRATAGDHHAAEDAFQATFLTLAKKANGIRDNLAGWLHRVAYHAALKARSTSKVSSFVEEIPAREVDLPAPDVAERIHAELAALPDRYRLPLVLCDLEGLTHAEAARQLGWPVGSVSGRLVRARERLKAKLLRRGIAPAAVALAALPLEAASPLIRLSTAAATGGTVPPSVAALSHGVLSAMRIAKLKLATTIVAGVVGLAGAVTVIGVSASPRPDDPPAKKAEPAAAKKADKPNIADAKQRVRSVNALKQIMLACWNYHDAMGHFPADVLDKDGKPILSWRVVILPYLEEAPLYNKFKLDEPWDSENNKVLAQTEVKVYSNGSEPKNTKYPVTFFQRPTGKGTFHEPGAKLKFTHVSDGLSNTICVVETEKAVEWAKPDDFSFDLAKPAGVRGPFANVIHCAFGDGSVHTFAGGLSAEAAKATIGRDDGINFDLAGYTGTGWPVRGDASKMEVAELLKELDDQTAELKKLLDENHKLLLEVTKVRGERLKAAGNIGLAQQLLELEKMIEQEKTRKARLEEELKGETVKPVLPMDKKK